MNRRLLIRFGLLLVAGVILVWIFGIDSDEGIFGRRQEKIKVSEAERLAHEARQDSDSDVSVTGAMIPVREELEDPPGAMVTQYVIHLGHTATGASRRMEASDVTVDIFNKKLPPEERLLARIMGDEAYILFTEAPDAASGFKGAAIESMTLMKNVLVEYLDESGETITKMRSEQLELSDREFHVPGHALITQEGLVFEGEGLTYVKSSGSFSFERNVRVVGEKFALPDLDGKEKKDAPDPAEPAPDDEVVAADAVKTITCKGPFRYLPAEDPEEDVGGANEKPEGEQITRLGGGVLTFSEEVVASQADTVLTCDHLEITLESVPAEGTGKDKLEVSQVVATGTAAAPANLADPKGRLVGETITLVKTDEGQVITLVGEPKIVDAQFGGEGENATTFTAGARNRIRFRPVPPDPAEPLERKEEGEAVEPAGASEEPAEPERDRIVLELLEAAYLQSQGGEEGQDFRIEGQRLELTIAQFQTTTAEGEEKSDIELEQLTASGAARGLFAGGFFTGDQIVARPREGSEGVANLEVAVSPNPYVELTSASQDEGSSSKITIRSDDGELTYRPPEKGSDRTEAVFTGPTHLDVERDGVVTSTLTAQDRVTVNLASASAEKEGGLQSLVAEGAVQFRNDAEQIVGTGERLDLIPAPDGSYQVRLAGVPDRTAVATVGAEGDENRKVVSGESIFYDPETGRLHAEKQVEARFAGLDLAANLGPQVEPAEPDATDSPAATDAVESTPPGQGTLRCEDLLVYTREEDQALVVEARQNVFFDDPERLIDATAHILLYDEATGMIELHGEGRNDAVLNRHTARKKETDPRNRAAVSGPLLLLDKVTNMLTVPDKGEVAMVRSDPDGKNEQTVAARSIGQIRYFDDRLVLKTDVVIRFTQDGVENRALWCDLATVFFSGGPDDTPAESGIGMSASGFNKIIAEGRVHMEQMAPRELIAEGQRLEWTRGTEDEVMFLSGTNPQCWVVGLLGDKDLRDEADWFRLYKNSEEVQAENGRTVLVQEIGQ